MNAVVGLIHTPSAKLLDECDFSSSDLSSVDEVIKLEKLLQNMDPTTLACLEFPSS